MQQINLPSKRKPEHTDGSGIKKGLPLTGEDNSPKDEILSETRKLK